jgi:NAD(P)-dependent dehydrogenase (short-subunit alcohol dehydrogenase family)
LAYPHDPFDLGGKVAVVTGALGLLGREHCAALASAGARVVATDLDGLGCRALTDELHDRYGIDCIGVRADVTDPESVDGLLRQTLERFDRVDVLVNNAAIDDKFDPSAPRDEARFESYSLERFRRILDVNVTGTFLVSQRIGTEMARRRGGSIVNVASTYGVVAPQQSLYLDENGDRVFWKGAAYPTSKGAVLSFTRFLAAYWGERGVRVNSLTPGGVQAGQSAHFQAEYSARTPLGRMASPRDYRGALLFLASDASAYMTGSNLIVDGGWTAW